MRALSFTKLGTVVAAAALMAACQSNPTTTVTSTPVSTVSTTAAPAAPAAAVQFGTVTNVDLIRTTTTERGGIGGSGVGAGAVIGGVAGGVLGNQVGGGDGRTLATVIGTVGGAVIGNAIEQGKFPGMTPKQAAQTTSDIYRVTVRQDNGTVRTFDYATRPNVSVNDRVRVENNQLYR